MSAWLATQRKRLAAWLRRLPDDEAAMGAMAVGVLAGLAADLAVLFNHTLWALGAQSLVGAISGHWAAGGVAACLFWAGREHAQAEARYIAQLLPTHHRSDMPWWAGFAPRAWTLDAFVFDLCLPIVAVELLYLWRTTNG
jgi:hypothetical protein